MSLHDYVDIVVIIMAVACAGSNISMPVLRGSQSSSMRIRTTVICVCSISDDLQHGSLWISKSIQSNRPRNG